MICLRQNENGIDLRKLIPFKITQMLSVLNGHSQNMFDILKLQSSLQTIKPENFMKVLPVVCTITEPISKMMKTVSISNAYESVCDL